MASAGRPPVLDSKKKDLICVILKLGGTRRIAAQYAGCAPSTIRRTADRDAEFCAALRKAESQHEVSYLQRINAAAKQERYWKAAAWALERIHPERYALPRPVNYTPQQVCEILERFMEIVMQEVPVEEFRLSILRRLEELTSELSGGPSEP
jgi:hypothetical protein